MTTEPDAPPAFDVDAVAALARLALTPDERARFSAQLSDVLAYVRQLADAPVESHGRIGQGEGARLREDVVTPSLPRDAAKANAADTYAGFFRVPPLRE
ncbi:MAG: Asp-tRNA(Asn)/Glu-tRNA(Gln) amidotransferase subunit GatC [Ardenticatenales bacterium]